MTPKQNFKHPLNISRIGVRVRVRVRVSIRVIIIIIIRVIGRESESEFIRE